MECDAEADLTSPLAIDAGHETIYWTGIVSLHITFQSYAHQR